MKPSAKHDSVRGGTDILSDFRKSEDGAFTLFGLYICAALIALGGIAVDVANIITARTHLQIAADAAAHTAIYVRDTEDANTAKARAVDEARANMPSERFGDIINVSDIEFGTYDHDTFQFTADPSSRSAVMVSAFRVSERTNSVGGFLLRIVGKRDWDMVVPSVFETYRPACLREGFVADNRVEIQSNNIYGNGFCIHSNTYVAVNSGNHWEDGTVVSMPRLSDLQLPNSGYESNTGLEPALMTNKYRLRILQRIEEITDGVQDPSSRHFRPWINSAAIVNLTGNKIKAADLTPNRIHRMTCNGGQIMIEANEIIKDVVIIGYGCRFQIGQGVKLIDTTLITTSANVKSINAPAGFQIGKDDNCAPGGGAQVVTYGGVDVAADLKMFGGQILALGPVAFSANANGIEGASIVSGSTIDGTSNMSMSFCGDGMENNFEAEYFRMGA